MFSKAIVRQPGESLIHGITTAGLVAPEFRKLDGGLSCLSLRF